MKQVERYTIELSMQNLYYQCVLVGSTVHEHKLDNAILRFDPSFQIKSEQAH